MLIRVQCGIYEILLSKTFKQTVYFREITSLRQPQFLCPYKDQQLNSHPQKRPNGSERAQEGP